MAAFALETTGRIDFGPHPEIELPAPFAFTRYIEWPDLSPFAQRYVEAVKRSFPHVAAASGETSDDIIDWRFSDLSPEALALILRDCDGFLAVQHPSRAAFEASSQAGANFWRLRQKGGYQHPPIPPLTPYLSDDGKVELKVAA